MTESDKSLQGAHVGGAAILRIARTQTDAAREQLRQLSPEIVADALLDLAPVERVEFLEMAERVDEIVPLLPETQFASTLCTVGIADAGWLVEFASSEQRVAAVDLDCWKDFRFSPSRLFEWIDAMIEAGPETLAASFFELDEELWVLAMRAMGDFSVLGLGDSDRGEGMTIDGLVFYDAHSAESDERIAEILRTALIYAPSQYWRLVYGAVSGGIPESAHFAARWQRNRLNDLGFPDREQAMRAYAPLDVEDTPVFESAPGASPDVVVTAADHFPAHLGGAPLAHALAELPAHRVNEVMSAVLAVANSLAVADRLPLAEPESIERSLARAHRGIERGLVELSRSQNRPIDVVLDATPALDLFRIGATLEPALRPQVSLADLVEDQDGVDWGVETEMISEADRAVGSDGRLKHS
jgi:hypothetical protein